MNISAQDKQILRELAAKYMSYASLPIQEEKRKLWKALNGLNMQKPMVTIDQMPWNELDVDGSLICQVKDPFFRGIENQLRQQIYKWEHLPVDMVLNPYIEIPRAVSDNGFGLNQVSETLVTDQANSVRSYHFVPQIEEPEDIEKIKDPVIALDTEETDRRFAVAHEIFDGIAPIRPAGTITHLGLWDKITEWMGVENIYIELLDRPEFMHDLMERLTQATLRRIDLINNLGLQDIYGNLCHCSYTFDEGAPDPDLIQPTTENGWAFGLAQLFSSVSPAITEEFEVPYMKRLFSRFGNIYYGCCEKLDDRLHIIDQMPNIRKISCSPWSDREHFAATLPKKYIMSNKPNPALLAGPVFDEEAVRADLRRTINAAKANNVCLEMLLKDVSTVRYEPQRLWRWAEIAAEETLRAAF